MEGQTNGQGSGVKKRKIQMDSEECLAHSKTDSGALPLTNPSEIKTSNQDVNRGLYPKQLKFNSTKIGPEERPHTLKVPCTSTNGSSASASEAAASSNILDDFENDTAFDCMEVFELVEKAESDTSSPCKSTKDWSSPYKTFQPHAATASPCRNFQGSRSFNLPAEHAQVGEDLFARLPVEVMENIFCRMPMLDLCLGVNLVCKPWNEIIKRDKVGIVYLYKIFYKVLNSFCSDYRPLEDIVWLYFTNDCEWRSKI